ncbi:cytochrome P450 [Talaromyces proteolyticus]|uniref:Cytochrome P450 n=1 Tax=Talaromyces proteolyticus TaxID=1131652 RepID=A0AAD4KKB1_9EURO|nr:cytochrome P450 [Talaromyces proteolyticus]KAH8692968.1 cytochrome P450 [Talaromyces proteolyticus]
MPLLSLVCVISGAALFLSRFLFIRRPKQLPLPPGPPGAPLVGNLFQAPKRNPWEKYAEWSKKYGPLMTLKNGNAITIVVTSYDIVFDLLAKNNHVFSSRPQPIVIERIGLGMTTSFLPDGDKWRHHRSLRRAVLSPAMAKKYRGVQSLESLQLLNELRSSADFSQCLRRSAVSLFLVIAYGKRLPVETPEVLEMEDTVAHIGAVSEACFRGTEILAEFFPILKLLPGNGAWKKKADRISSWYTELYLKRFREALKLPSWNWAKQYDTTKNAKGMAEIELAYCIGSVYEAALTPYELVRLVFLCAVFHPEETAKMQRQIDEVVGRNRLPTWEDADKLPLVSAFYREALRWRPWTPLATPRATTEEITYKGYRIPKDATVIINQWALDRDPAIFGDPEAFRPQRWLDNPDLPHVRYGYGHRGCPGQHVGKDYMFINMARLFWAYNVGYAYEGGKKVDLDFEAMMDPRNEISFFNQVPDFRASLTIRDAQSERLVEQEWLTAEKDEQKLLAEVEVLDFTK